MKLLKKGLCLFLAGILALMVGYMPFTINALSTTPIAMETKIYSQASIEDDFVDNHVLVVLTNEASLKFKTYTPADFPEITCAKMTELTEPVTPSVRLRVEGGVEKQDTNAVKISTQDPSSFNQILCLELPVNSKEGVLEAIAALQKRDDVLYVGPDYYVHGYSRTPNDPKITSQWGINKISLPAAWDITTGSSDVLVGVMDTGIEASHDDLQDRVNVSLSRTYLSTPSTVNVTTNPGLHGTLIAGIIGAEGDNGKHGTGVCWDVTLVSLRVLENDLSGESSAVVSAIHYAESISIDIINCSLGLLNLPTSERIPFYEAIENYSGLLVCAAGNHDADNDTLLNYPSWFALPNILCVAGSNESDTRAEDSNYGDVTVDLFAPGEVIYSTEPGNDFTADSGTSFAAPFVTGVAALMLSIHPELTPTQLKQTIMDNVDHVAALANLCVSGGRLNAYKALTDDDIHSYTGNASGHFCTGTNCDYWESHTYTVTPYNTNQHKHYCAQCSYATYANHTYRVGSTICTVCGYNSSGLEEMGVYDITCVIA